MKMLKNTWLYKNNIAIIAIIVIIILTYIRWQYATTNCEDNDFVTDIASIIGSIATAASVLLLTSQLKLQRNKDNTELVLNLYREFYNNKSYSELFSIIDNDYHKMCDNEFSLNQVLEVIIESEPFDSKRDSERDEIKKRFDIELPEEKDLCN
jgi:hypothetical protein